VADLEGRTRRLARRTAGVTKKTSRLTSGKARDYAIWFAILLSILLPFGISVLYVHEFGVNVLFADEWDFLVLVRELQHGTLGVADLFAHHNEHVYFFPWIVMLMLGSITDYNTIPLMYLVQLCILVTTLGVFFAYERGAGRLSSFHLLFIPIPFVLFSFRQYENMLWGNQITFAFAQTFSVVALCCLQWSRGARYASVIFPVALASATVASFSAVQGLLIWPAGFVLLLIAYLERSIRWSLLWGWVVVGLGAWVVYLLGYAKPESTPPLSFVLDHPLTALDYFLTLLGGSLFWKDNYAFGGGLLLFGLAVVGLWLNRRHGKTADNAFWIALLFFSFLSLALITVGRSGYGDEAPFAQALASRFTAFSILAVVSLYAMFVNLSRESRSHFATVLLVVILAMVVASIPRSYSVGMVAGKATESHRELAAVILANYRSQSDVALRVFANDPRRVRTFAHMLERHRYSVFSDRRSR
jgi:hypothetical protein